MPKDARSRRNQLFLLALIVVGIGVFVLFTNIDRAMLRQTLDETYTYVETRLHLYEVDAANDRIKSLTRLQDKAAALRDEMTIKGDFTPSDLNAFADTQRLTGVLVLDGELQLEMQSTRDGNAMQLWKQQLQSDYVRDILDCPQKSYAANIEQDGKLYDFAALARTDAPGLLIAYVKKSSEDVGDLTVGYLLDHFPLEDGGVATICQDDRVLTSNSTAQLNRTSEECRQLYNDKQNPCVRRHCRAAQQPRRLVRQPQKYQQVRGVCLFPGGKGIFDAQHHLRVLPRAFRDDLFDGAAAAKPRRQGRLKGNPKAYGHHHGAGYGV